MQILTRNRIEPSAYPVSVIFIVKELVHRSRRSGKTGHGICRQSPLIIHSTVLVKGIFQSIDGLGSILHSLSIFREIEIVVHHRIVIFILFQIFPILFHIDQIPSALSGAIILSAAVIHCVMPLRTGIAKLRVVIDPTPKHLSILIKGIFLAIDGLKRSTVITSHISPSVILEIVPYIYGRILIAIFFVLIIRHLNPLIFHHGSILIGIIDIAIIFDQLFVNNITIISQVEPVVAALLPLVGDFITVFIVIHPTVIRLHPAGLYFICFICKG